MDSLSVGGNLSLRGEGDARKARCTVLWLASARIGGQCDLSDADIAFAEVNTMDDLGKHPHLRRIEVDTPNGKVSYAAPAAIFVGQPRQYGAVPGIGDHHDLPKAQPVRKSS